MRLSVSGAQPLFTLGLLMFALSLVDFLSLLLSSSTYFKIFYFCQKYHLKDTYKIINWLSCERLPFEVFFSCLCDGPLGIVCANMLANTQRPLERAAHLTSLVWVCVLWLPESLMDLSALWLIRHNYVPGLSSITKQWRSTLSSLVLTPQPFGQSHGPWA